ncbi:hypothetical protein ACLKMH_09620 [Psychromonas sp. KJ10-10]|uniref:hypothetical protein n=1 Tax=Psychromonas sp. KJ10-10 TaxID=3391823 RepID=UPI0039B68D87
MGKSTLLILPFIALLTAGCSHKAEPGHGGMAEHHLMNIPDHPVGLENALYFEQRLSNRHLDDLILAGAKICFPASEYIHSTFVKTVLQESYRVV